MAHKKSKYDILDKIINKELIAESYLTYYDDDFDYWEHNYWCDCFMCVPVDYEYLPDEFQPKPILHVSKRGLRLTEHSYSQGRLIDMNSIYSKEVLRQKRINHILGIESMEHTPKTLGDILNIKK